MSWFDNIALFLTCSIILKVGKMLHVCISLKHLNYPDFLKWYVLSGQLAIKYWFCPYNVCDTFQLVDIGCVKVSFTNINYERACSYFSPNSFQSTCSQTLDRTSQQTLIWPCKHHITLTSLRTSRNDAYRIRICPPNNFSRKPIKANVHHSFMFFTALCKLGIFKGCVP